MLLTLTRRQETALARWRDVDMEARTWTIPETKNGEMHVVPLSWQAMDLLRSRLPADGAGNPQRPEPGALIFATSTGAPLGNWDRETKALQEASGTKAGPVTICGAPARRCWAKWASCRTSSRPR